MTESRLGRATMGILILFVGVLVTSVCVGDTPAEKAKKDANVAPAGAADKAKPDPNAEALGQIALANSLVQYARKNKSPEALVTAAHILGTTPTRPLDVKPTTEKDAKTPQATTVEKKETKPNQNEPTSLLAEAKKMSSNDPHIVGIADQVERSIGKKPRGAVGGPKVGLGKTASAYSTDVYTITFRGGEYARVILSGDGDTDLDLYVYDQGGHLVSRDDDYSDDCICTWVPAWTGDFTIMVKNRGPVYNRYVIGTN